MVLLQVVIEVPRPPRYVLHVLCRRDAWNLSHSCYFNCKGRLSSVAIWPSPMKAVLHIFQNKWVEQKGRIVITIAEEE